MFERFIIVLLRSRRTWAVLAIGIVGFLGFMMVATFYLPQQAPTSSLAPMSEAVAQIVHFWYRAAAYGTLGGAMLLAIKYFIKDYRRIFE